MIASHMIISLSEFTGDRKLCQVLDLLPENSRLQLAKSPSIRGRLSLTMMVSFFSLSPFIITHRNQGYGNDEAMYPVELLTRTTAGIRSPEVWECQTTNNP